MEIGSIGDRIANIDPDPKANGSISGLVTVVNWDFLLHFHGAPNGTVYTVENNQQRISACLNDPATVLFNCWIDQIPAQSTQPFKRSRIIQADQPGVTNHVGIDNGNQLTPIWRLFALVRCLGHRHGGPS
jgi:hypothetical protein